MKIKINLDWLIKLKEKFSSVTDKIEQKVDGKSQRNYSSGIDPMHIVAGLIVTGGILLLAFMLFIPAPDTVDSNIEVEEKTRDIVFSNELEQTLSTIMNLMMFLIPILIILMVVLRAFFL